MASALLGFLRGPVKLELAHRQQQRDDIRQRLIKDEDAERELDMQTRQARMLKELQDEFDKKHPVQFVNDGSGNVVAINKFGEPLEGYTRKEFASEAREQRVAAMGERQAVAQADTAEYANTAPVRKAALDAKAAEALANRGRAASDFAQAGYYQARTENPERFGTEGGPAPLSHNQRIQNERWQKSALRYLDKEINAKVAGPRTNLDPQDAADIMEARKDVDNAKTLEDKERAIADLADMLQFMGLAREFDTKPYQPSD